MARAKVTSSSHGEANVFGLGFFRENLEFISVVGMPIMVFKN